MNKLSIPCYWQSMPPTRSEFVSYVRNVTRDMQERIQEGYANPYASTGIPMAQLHGSAYVTALLSNIGIPRNQGGAGFIGGLEVLLNYVYVMGTNVGYNLCCYHNDIPIPETSIATID